jgi:hypothetical protein
MIMPDYDRYDTMPSDPDMGHPMGMVGIIDEERGGIIAWAVDQSQADELIKQLMAVEEDKA